MQSYWERTIAHRVDRRRVLATTGATSIAAALLAACGRGSSSSGGKSASSLVAEPVDTSKQAKQGGVYKGQLTQDVQTLEPSFRSAPAATHSQRAYQNLFSQKPGYLAPQKDEYEGDVVESWEFSPDRLQLTMKIRTEGKWDTRAPTNGRNVEAADVVSTWNRFAKVASLRADYANSVNPAAPVVSMTATDAKTVSVKLAEPQAGILALLATRSNSGYWVLPKEVDSGFDPKKDQRGSGPYVLTEYVPSARFVYEKSPGYFNKDKLAIQRLEYPIVTEYAQSMAQLKNGGVYTFLVRSEDILGTKRDTPELNMYKTDVATTGFRWFFGFENGAKPPFRDVRLRQAFSMSIDRDLFIDTFYNVAPFRSAGIDMDRSWNTAARCDAAGWWLDPLSKDFGENVKYYKKDLTAAKQLISAAGFPNGLDVDAHHITTNDYGPDFPPQIQALIGMANDSGLRVKSVPANFATEWQQKYRDVKGNFDGMAFVLQVGSGDPGDLMFALFNSGGSQFMGFDPNGQSTFKGDPTMDDLTNKMRREFDANKRYQYGFELQRYEAKMQYYPMFPGGANGFNLVWPAVENFAVNRGGYFLEYYLSINDQKAPLKKA